MTECRNRHILLAGGTSELGKQLTHVLTAQGANVTITGRSGSATWELPTGATYVQCDVTLEPEVAALVQQIPPVDGVFPLIGGWRGGGGIAGQRDEDYRALEPGLTATRHLGRHFFEALAASERGRFAVVSTTSLGRPLAGGANYASVKAASETWVKAIAHGFEKHARDTDTPLKAAAVILRVSSLNEALNETAHAFVQLLNMHAQDVNGTTMVVAPNETQERG